MKKDAFLVLRGVRQRLCCEVVQLIGVFPSLCGDPCEPLQGNFFFHYIACAGYSRGCTYQLLTLFCLICLLFFFSSRVGATIQLLSCFSFFFSYHGWRCVLTSTYPYIFLCVFMLVFTNTVLLTKRAKKLSRRFSGETVLITEALSWK